MQHVNCVIQDLRFPHSYLAFYYLLFFISSFIMHPFDLTCPQKKEIVCFYLYLCYLSGGNHSVRYIEGLSQTSQVGGAIKCF